jgi:hypothetical protein
MQFINTMKQERDEQQRQEDEKKKVQGVGLATRLFHLEVLLAHFFTLHSFSFMFPWC